MLDKLCGIERCSHSADANATGITAKSGLAVIVPYLASFGQGCILVEGNRLSSELMSNRKISGAIAGELLDSDEPDSSGDEGAN